ncbi:hypothetical protein D3C76_1506880 [compost metagenome]
MHEQHLQRRATLAIERQCPSYRFTDGVIEVDIAQHSGRISSTPNFAGLNTTVLPMMSAGINVVNVSFTG